MLLNLKARREHAELVIGIVGAVGSKLSLVQEKLVASLNEMRYQAQPVHLIELLHEIDKWEVLTEDPEEDRIEQHMNAGDEFRHLINSDDALAILGVGKIRKLRRQSTGDENEPARRTAYVLKSLKHPVEIGALREIYGPGFLVVSAYSPREIRVQHLAEVIAHSHNSQDADAYREHAERLINRDQQDALNPFGQNVRQSFPVGDVFVDSTDERELLEQIERFVQLVLGNSFLTPTRDEYAMVHAHSAALRSGALGRQVGAVVATPEGQIVAAGTNEVPKFGGGQYWFGDEPDNRDINKDLDSSDTLKQTNIGEMLDRLAEQDGWLAENKRKLPSNERVKAALPLLKGIRIMQPLEYGRAVHAEMAAIIDAGMRSVPVKGNYLYTTTFPCHECARHIIDAGIERVVYIEPYPKSLATRLHNEEIAVESTGRVQGRVRFEPFVGVAPRQYFDLFPIFEERKSSEGRRLEWDNSRAVLRLQGFPESYIENEKDALNLLYNRMTDAKLNAILGGGDDTHA